MDIIPSWKKLNIEKLRTFYNRSIHYVSATVTFLDTKEKKSLSTIYESLNVRRSACARLNLYV